MQSRTQNQIFIILAVLRRNVKQVEEPSHQLSTWPTHLRRSVTTVARLSNLTGLKIEPTPATRIAIFLTIELTGNRELSNYITIQATK